MRRRADDYRRKRLGAEHLAVEDYQDLLDKEDAPLDKEDVEILLFSDLHKESNLNLLVGTLPHVLSPESSLNEFAAWLRVYMDEVNGPQFNRS
jgi:hypothetical protein